MLIGYFNLFLYKMSFLLYFLTFCLVSPFLKSYCMFKILVLPFKNAFYIIKHHILYLMLSRHAELENVYCVPLSPSHLINVPYFPRM